MLIKRTDRQARRGTLAGALQSDADGGLDDHGDDGERRGVQERVAKRRAGVALEDVGVVLDGKGRVVGDQAGVRVDALGRPDERQPQRRDDRVPDHQQQDQQ